MKRSRIGLWLEIAFVLLVPLLMLSSGLKLVLSVGYASAIVLTLLLLRAWVLLRFIRLVLRRFHKGYIVPQRSGGKANLALLGTSVLVLFLLLEIVFMFVPQTQDVYKLGLGNKVWNLYYRQPENELGFRDKPLQGRLATSKQTIFFLGDSYTYGSGIRNNEERFPDMVYAQMDTAKFEAFNLGKANTDTRDEYIRLVNFGRKPDYLILQYYHNDIEKVGAARGHFNQSQTGYKAKKPSFAKKAALFLGLIPVETSYFLNFIAFNSAGLFFTKAGNDYKECLTEAYQDKACVEEHLRDLEAIIRYSELNHIRLYVLFIPDVRDIDFTQGLFDAHIIPYLKSRAVPYITVDEQFRKYKASELVINRLNAHTNPFANGLMAEQVLRAIPDLNR